MTALSIALVAWCACAAAVVVDESGWGYGPVSRQEEKQMLAEADWSRRAYAEKLWSVHNETLRTYQHTPRKEFPGLKTGPQIMFVGDSIACELCGAADKMGFPHHYCIENYLKNDILSGDGLEDQMIAALQTHDTVVMHTSIHYLTRKNFDIYLKPQYLPKYGTPILVRRELFNHTLSVAGVALKAAESLGFANRTVIVCTAMPLDTDMLLSSPPKADWMQFEDMYLSHLWGEVDAKYAAATRLHPRVIVAPLHRFARRYPGVRIDGMHYGSWVPNSSVLFSKSVLGQFQGVFYPFLLSLLDAHRRALLEPAARSRY